MASRDQVIDERGDIHYFKDDVFTALAAVGLIWREGDTWRMDSSRVNLGQWPELAVCDFCSERPVTWDIEADDFALIALGAPTWHSVQGWVACETCGGLIVAGNRSALDARSVAFVKTSVPAGHAAAPYVAAQRHLLAQFWRHYRGIRRYATPYDL